MSTMQPLQAPPTTRRQVGIKPQEGTPAPDLSHKGTPPPLGTAGLGMGVGPSSRQGDAGEKSVGTSRKAPAFLR